MLILSLSIFSNSICGEFEASEYLLYPDFDGQSYWNDQENRLPRKAAQTANKFLFEGDMVIEHTLIFN